jgi:hypothetical protein
LRGVLRMFSAPEGKVGFSAKNLTFLPGIANGGIRADRYYFGARHPLRAS